jgi:hypothetical protein
MGTIAFVVGLAVLGQPNPSAVPQEPADETVKSTWEEAVAILEKVNDAAKAVHIVSYRGSYHATGWLAERVPSVEGTALIGGIELDRQRFRGF